MTTETIDGFSLTTLDLSMVPSPPSGRLTIASCPGLCKEHGSSEERQMHHLKLLQERAVDLVVALTPDDELERLGVAAMPLRIQDAGLDWKQVAVVNFSTPEKDQQNQFMDAMNNVKSRLDDGEHILVHCQGGRGRAGKVAAVMLIHFGIDPDQAIGLIRDQREGCIQTPEQEAFVRDYIPR